MNFDNRIRIVDASKRSAVVWADRRSIKRSEFYKAQSNGTYESSEFFTWLNNYRVFDSPLLIECGKKQYKIEREYVTGDFVTIVCSDLDCECVVYHRTSRGNDALTEDEYAPDNYITYCAYIDTTGAPGTTETNKGGHVSDKTNAAVTMLYRDDVEAHDRLLIGGRTFEITYADNVGMRGHWLKLYVREVENDAE